MATYCPEDGGDRELFSCPICFEDYDLQDTRRAPKLLLCLHTFCYECTTKLWKNGAVECSMCRMLHEKVLLEELFDNHVIIQHLQKEREERDFEFAQQIDQELRNEYGGSPVMVARDGTAVEPSHDVTDDGSETIEILDSSDETNELDIPPREENNSPRISNMDEEEEQGQDRSEREAEFLAELLESLRGSPQPPSDSEEENEEVNVADEMIDVAHTSEEVAGEDDDDSSNDSNEDSGNPTFCFDNIHNLLQDENDDDDAEEERVSEDEVEADEELVMENIQRLLGYTDNDDEEEEDERFHSACDDINVTCWEGDDDLAMHEGSEDDTETNTYCWQIMNQETLMDD